MPRHAPPQGCPVPADRSSMRSCIRRPARAVSLALVAAILVCLPGPAHADPAIDPAQIRIRISSLVTSIVQVREEMERQTDAVRSATWILFKARRVLDLARLALRDARLWETAPDVLRLSLLGTTPLEQAVAEARARYRTLTSSPRVGGAAGREEALRRRLAGLEVEHARWTQALVTVERPPTSEWGGGTPDAGEWASAFLAEIDAPPCGENRVLMLAWQAQESTEARFNPLGTTHDMPGAANFNSVGVKSYRSVAQGLDASRLTLEGGAASYGYEAILSSLRACADAEATAWLVNASAWCRGCTAGAYLTGILPAVRADHAAYAAR